MSSLNRKQGVFLSLIISIILFIGIALFLNSVAEEYHYVRFVNPWSFLIILILIPILFYTYFVNKYRQPYIVFSRTSSFKIASAGKINIWKILAWSFRISALTFMVIALARPQGGTEEGSTEVEGIDTIIVMDCSYSMNAQDMSGTRIDAAKDVVLEYIRRRTNDRIGAVVFGREAYLLMPLTTDYNVLANSISELTLGIVDGRGTAIGNAVGMAINRLRKSNAESKVIILLTDGANNSGNISPTQAAQFARTLGIKIYSILIGQENAPSVLGLDILGRKIVNPSQANPVNPALLEEMSTTTGGEFARATNKSELERQIIRIDQLEKSPLEDIGVLYAETYTQFIIIALILLFLDLIVRFWKLRRLA